MPESSPYFSIVIPTRNRANLLRWSLQTALAQDFDDYEIVVVNNDCSDDTDAVVESLKTDRVRYFKTGRTLAMPDNWEFAWTKARGKYVTYLCDDDALLPGALRFLAEKVLPSEPVVATWESALYYYPEGADPARKNTLTINPGDGTVERRATRPLLDMAYRFDYHLSLPKMLNCCVEAERFEQFRGRLGRIFWPSCPDYSIMSIALHCLPEIDLIHRPLMIWGESPQSIGATTSTSHGEATERFRKEFGEFDFFEGTPIHAPVVANYIAGTFVLMQGALKKAGVEPHPIDWAAFLSRAADQYTVLAPHLGNREMFEQEFRTAARAVSPACLAEVEKILAKTRSSEAHPLGKLIESSAFLSRLETRVRYKGDASKSRRPLNPEPGVYLRGKQVQVKGGDVGASNILEITRLVDGYFDRYCKG